MLKEILKTESIKRAIVFVYPLSPFAQHNKDERYIAVCVANVVLAGAIDAVYVFTDLLC